MFTSEDRVVIDENVRLNEETHFGSQDFEKFILPKLTFNNESESDEDEDEEENEEREKDNKPNTTEEVIPQDENGKEEKREDLVKDQNNTTSDESKNDDSELNSPKETNSDRNHPNETMTGGSKVRFFRGRSRRVATFLHLLLNLYGVLLSDRNFASLLGPLLFLQL